MWVFSGVAGSELLWPFSFSKRELRFAVAQPVATRSPCLSKKGILAQKIELKESGIEGDINAFLEGLDCLVLNIPPGLRSNPNVPFTSRIRPLESQLQQSGIPHLIFISSTSVYGRDQGEVDETDLPAPDTETGRQLERAESILLQNPSRKTQVVRPGGLLGPDRHPVFSLSGNTYSSGGQDRVNLIRLEDLLNILQALILNDWDSGIFNAVYPEHPSKRDFYIQEATHFGIAPPTYPDAGESRNGKIVRSSRLQEKGYKFSHSIWSR